jgi:hypothetical protein
MNNPVLIMIIKRLLRPDRLRQIPSSFSWVDHRLVRQNHLAQCDHRAWALYLFIATVGDVQGLSYYSDASVGRQLKLDLLEVAAARQQLLQAGLIAYQKPIYQVLALPETAGGPTDSSTAPRSGQTQCVGDILRRALAGGAL